MHSAKWCVNVFKTILFVFGLYFIVVVLILILTSMYPHLNTAWRQKNKDGRSTRSRMQMAVAKAPPAHLNVARCDPETEPVCFCIILLYLPGTPLWKNYGSVNSRVWMPVSCWKMRLLIGLSVSCQEAKTAVTDLQQRLFCMDRNRLRRH